MIYIKDRFDCVEDGIKYLINTLVNHYYNDLCGGRSYMFTDRRVLKMTKLETDSWDYRQAKKYFIILHNNIPWGYIVNIDDDNKFNMVAAPSRQRRRRRSHCLRRRQGRP